MATDTVLFVLCIIGTGNGGVRVNISVGFRSSFCLTQSRLVTTLLTSREDSYLQFYRDEILRTSEGLCFSELLR